MTPAEVAERLGIQSSTLRKYSLLFEKEQIVFSRSKNNSRNYTDIQVAAIQEAITLSHNADVTLEDAVRVAAKKLKMERDITPEEGVTDIAPQRHNDDITAVMMSEIATLKKEIAEHEKAAVKREEERKNRELMFVEAMEKMQESMDAVLLRLPEQRKEPAPEERTQDMAPETVEETPKRKSLFSRFFKK